MPRIVTAEPETLAAVLQSVAPDTVVELRPGRYREPVRLAGRQGRPDAPIVIRALPGARFDGGQTVDDFTPRAEAVAREAKGARRYPGVYPIAHEAHLQVVDCAWITLEGLAFERCWPTAIWIEGSHDLALRRVDVVDGSFAVYAKGETTRGLLLDGCTWLQDPTRHRLWRDTYWDEVHGSTPASGGARAFDGSFFLGDGIAGDLEIRGCTVEHAFNGVHCFNPAKDPRLNRNVSVHGNRFAWIKDNPIEPEDVATRWWVCDNEIVNGHKWFSFEMEAYGHLYVFQNAGWFDDRPGPPDEENSGGAVFKVDDTGVERPLGPVYVVNNSWFLRSTYIKAGQIRDFHHVNNAIRYCDAESFACDPTKTFFGKAGAGFTTDWGRLAIEFAGDLVSHRDFPDTLRQSGYPIQDGTHADPGFLDPAGGDLALRPDSLCRGRGRPLTLALPDGGTWSSKRPLDVGAVQTWPDAFDGLRPPSRA
jgi:hypothetical protein